MKCRSPWDRISVDEVKIYISMSKMQPNLLRASDHCSYVRVWKIGGGDRRRHEKESHPSRNIAYSRYLETPYTRFRPIFSGQ